LAILDLKKSAFYNLCRVITAEEKENEFI